MTQDSEFVAIQVDDKGLAEKLDAVHAKILNLTPVMEVIGQIGLTSIAKNFEAGGRYSEPGSWRGGDKKWKPLSVVTLFGSEGLGSKKRNRRKANFKTDGSLSKRGEKRLNKKILIGQGNLLNSINSNAGVDFVEWGTNLVYAAIHNFGGKAGRGRKVNIPARPYMVLQNEDLEEINNVLDDFLLGAI